VENRPILTIDQHVSAVRHNRRDSLPALVDALKSDPALMQEARRRLALFKEMERADRLRACWISRLTQETLTVAFTAIETQPGVPAGD
jgi:hypothetical protein